MISASDWLSCSRDSAGGRARSAIFERLVEAFDLALGLRVVGLAVLLGDARLGQDLLEAVAGVV